MVLRTLIENSMEVRYRNTVQGFGLSESQFTKLDKDSRISRRLFNHRRKKFKEFKYIKSLKSRGKKIKYFSITPLGIAYYLKNNSINSFNLYQKILKTITSYSNKNWIPIEWIEKTTQIKKETMGDIVNELEKKLSKKIFNLHKQIDSEKLYDALVQSFRDIKINKENNLIEIYLTQSLPDKSNFVISKFTIQNDDFNLDFTHFESKKFQKFSNQQFFEYISKHIIYAFLYNLYKYNNSTKLDNDLKQLVQEYSSILGIRFMTLASTYGKI